MPTAEAVVNIFFGRRLEGGSIGGFMKGFYLLGVEQSLPNNNGGEDKYLKHYLVQTYDPEKNEETGKVFVRDPIVRSMFLKPGILEVLPAGTPIEFELDSKMRKTNEGKEYEVIVPTNIKAVTRSKAS